MNNTLKTTLIVVAVLFGAAILMAGGFFFGQNFMGRTAFANGQFPFNFMHRSNNFNQPYGFEPDMMGRGFSRQYDNPAQTSRPYGMGPSMMGGGMMGRGYSASGYTGNPLSIEEAKDAFDDYLADLGDKDLVVHEVMVFDQNAYAVIIEESTGIAAMELLVDHGSRTVFPEYGPNMMWNQKYGMMSGGRGNFGGKACCAEVFSANEIFELDAMPVTLEEAKSAAQIYLDDAVPGASVAGKGFTFYGYYTFDYEVDGEMAGMLSVNGYTSAVWPHIWHGQFIEEADFE